MSTTVRRSQGTLSLEKTEAAIAAFESGFAKFQKNELIASPDALRNMITFENLDLELPNEFKLTLSTDSAPIGYTKVWDGAMYVNGTSTQVTAWRKD